MNEKIKILSPKDTVDDVLFDMMSHPQQNLPYPEHSHDCIEIGIVYGGTAKHLLSGSAEQIQRGDVFIIHSGGIHGFFECKRFEHMTISCSTEILSMMGINFNFIYGIGELFSGSPKVASFHLNNSEFNDARRLIDSMYKLYMHNKIDEKANIRAYFSMLICLLAQSYTLHHNSDAVPERLSRAVTYINEHFKEKISLPEIAAKASLSVSQFGRIFKATYDMSPFNYVLELRLNEARRLLKHGSLSISEIAFIVGFNDTNYFSRAYKKYFGLSPTKTKNIRD